MAFWFSVVLASYIFIWLITDNYELITTGTLVLIGIGAGTGLGAVSINNNKADKTIKQIQDLQKQQADLRQATDLLKAALPAAGIEAKIGYNNFLDCQLTSNIDNLINGLREGKDNFINDILTDENGVSFHRLQMVVFTTVLGFVFVYTAYATLTMPDFSTTLLTMQGITAGTYLGFKIPEKLGT
jgi:outer membrane murein-binding lipoprotein Lpp